MYVKQFLELVSTLLVLLRATVRKRRTKHQRYREIAVTSGRQQRHQQHQQRFQRAYNLRHECLFCGCSPKGLTVNQQGETTEKSNESHCCHLGFMLYLVQSRLDVDRNSTRLRIFPSRTFNYKLEASLRSHLNMFSYIYNHTAPESGMACLANEATA